MHRSALACLIAVACVPHAAAQLPLDLCRPPLITGPTPMPGLGAAAFGVAEIAQLSAVPDGAGGFEGIATVRPLNSTSGLDLLNFTWAGIGAAPVTTSLANALNGPDDEFQGSLARDRRAIVFDAGPGHPIGGGQACVATRSAPGLPFGSTRRLSGVPAGPIDPALGRIGGRDVLYFLDGPARIRVGEVDLDPTSPGFAAVTNPRDAVDGSAIAGLLALHSPAPQFDARGETVGLALGAWVAGTGSDAWYQSAAECGLFPLAQAQGRLLFALDEHGADWLGNPLLLGGTAVYARGIGSGYLLPERYDFFPLTSTSVPSSGGTTHLVAQLPIDEPDLFAGVVHIGLRYPTPIDPMLIGLAGRGLLCVAPWIATPAALFSQGELATDLAIPPIAPGIVLDAQCLAVAPATGRIWLSNVAVVEVRP